MKGMAKEPSAPDQSGLTMIAFAISFVCMLVLLSGQLSVVLLRALAGFGAPWLDDVSRYAFAGVASLSIAHGLVANRHVRIDLLSSLMGERARRHRDRYGVPLFILVLAIGIAWPAFSYVASSARVLEASPQTGGLPGLFVVKSLLLILPLLLIWQAKIRAD